MANKSCNPVNTKSLLAFIFGQMGKLDNGEIDVATAVAQAKLAKQANNVLDYELKRCQVQMQLDAVNRTATAKLRDIESLGFDDAKVPPTKMENAE